MYKDMFTEITLRQKNYTNKKKKKDTIVLIFIFYFS